MLKDAKRLLDLGSGAGFPALPLKLVCPALEVVSVDAVGKKIAFQRHVARTLRLTGFSAVHGRAEDLPDSPLCAAGFDVVTRGPSAICRCWPAWPSPVWSRAAG